jgi:hypothetical protein
VKMSASESSDGSRPSLSLPRKGTDKYHWMD